MALPLKRNISLVIVATGVILAALLALGFRQTQLARSHAEITAQAEKTLFQFTIIREHLHELLLAGQYDKLPRVAAELEELNDNLARLLGAREITGEYRLGLLNGMDLAGTILLVRKLGEGPATPEGTRQLNSDMRALNERLLLFDRLLVSSAKARLIGFQNVVIGMLALLLSVLIGILVWLRRRMVVPLAQLGTDAERAVHDAAALLPLPKGCLEIETLGETLTGLLAHRQRLTEEAAGCRRLTATVKRATQAMATASDRQQLFREVCRALLHNPEYCLVWIGEPDAAGTGIQPAAADGSTTMSQKECESCLAVLLTEAEERDEARNPALIAMRSRQPAVVPEVLAGIPRGLLNGTPLADRDAACVALPIAWQGRLYGVISIYALSAESFAEQDLALLASLTAALGAATAALAGEAEGVGHDACRLALLGEIATGVAHEISDLSNGMINYAQVLADEVPEGSHQAGLLGNLITAGEHVAAMVAKLVFYGEAGQPEEFLPLLDVLHDAMTLGGYHLCKSGIQVTLNLPAGLPVLPVNARQLQPVLLEIFSHARRALNLRYPGRHENKRFQIDGQVAHNNGREVLRLAFTDHGLGLAPLLEPARESAATTDVEAGLNRGREIVTRHGGTMTITGVPGESTTITLEFPVH